MMSEDYQFLSSHLLDSSGLSLGPGKEYLLEARLVPLAQSWGLNDIQELVQALRKGQDKQLMAAVTEAMTTNETSFFRDKSPFEDLKEHLLPALMEARKLSRTLRIWCAASSSGQEPYSLLMLINDHFPSLLKDWQLEFIATDISNNILMRAEAGVYTQFEVQRGLPIQLLMKYFQQCPAGWQIKDDIRKRVKFRYLNLLENFHSLGPFDLIMCRNVLIYFETSVKQQILERMHKLMRSDGYLMMGAAETVLGITDTFTRFKPCTSAVYAPKASSFTTGLKS
ncbi:MAG: protein-glutamate O-methyltransferase CheR [Planctomycetales bacterium]